MRVLDSVTRWIIIIIINPSTLNGSGIANRSVVLLYSRDVAVVSVPVCCKGIYFLFTLFNTASYAAPQIPPYRTEDRCDFGIGSLQTL
jgi:hypothetical protein